MNDFNLITNYFASKYYKILKEYKIQVISYYRSLMHYN